LRRFLLLALLCTACSNDRAAPDSTLSHLTETRATDALVLRAPRKGGLARVYLYPKLDSAVWTDSSGPSLERVLAFDPDAGTIAFVDTRGLPGRIDLRMTEVRTATRTKLTSLSSANGTDIYGIDGHGQVLRLNPNGGDWKFKPAVPARTVFAQPNGELIIAANKGAQTLLWRVRPPDDEVQDSAVLPLSGRGVRTQVGDRLYFTVDSGLVGVKAKDLSPAGAVKLETPVVALAPTPSGDRLYVATAGDSGLSVIDRYSESGQTRIALPVPPIDLRMDALGRYLLARFPKADSAWVIAIGTNRLVGAVPTRWETDLPAVTPDGMLAVIGPKDVEIVDPEKLEVKTTVSGGAKDFWYFFAWDGFRPRAQGLDQPVTFPGDSLGVDSSTASSTASSTSASSTTPVLPQPGDTARSPGNSNTAQSTTTSPGFTVSFAALLSEEKAQQLASSIKVNGIDAHVVSTTTAGSPIFRVVMGPYPTREEADKIGRASKREYWIFEGSP
jgi:cell division septation protein DedD